MNNLLKLVVSVVWCLLVGILGTPFTTTAIPSWYATLTKPFFAPPNWIFGPMWTLLYILMGVALYLVWKIPSQKKKTAIQLFLVQLALNFLWSPVFFGMQAPLLGLMVIISLWGTIILTMRAFFPLSRTAFYLMVPYLLWVSFATILNGAIVILN